VPDHTLGYIDFEGVSTGGTHGAGKVAIWDQGKFEAADDAEELLRKGRLPFKFYGAKLKGQFTLIKFFKDEKNRLIIKSGDEFADYQRKIETVSESKQKRKIQRRFPKFLIRRFAAFYRKWSNRL
jgi:hypothetical protein